MSGPDAVERILRHEALLRRQRQGRSTAQEDIRCRLAVPLFQHVSGADKVEGILIACRLQIQGNLIPQRGGADGQTIAPTLQLRQHGIQPGLLGHAVLPHIFRHPLIAMLPLLHIIKVRIGGTENFHADLNGGAPHPVQHLIIDDVAPFPAHLQPDVAVQPLCVEEGSVHVKQDALNLFLILHTLSLPLRRPAPVFGKR